MMLAVYDVYDVRLLDGRYSFLPEPSGLTSSPLVLPAIADDCNCLCLLIWQEIFHFSYSFYMYLPDLIVHCEVRTTSILLTTPSPVQCLAKCQC